jgi:PAS domain-containing protein
LQSRCHVFSNLNIASVERAFPGTALAMEALDTRTLENGVALALAVISLALVAIWLLERRRRVAAEKLHAASQERLALISSIASLGFWSWDAATDRVWASKQARSILALNAETALTGASLLAVIHPEDRPSVAQIINSSGPAIDTMEMELRILGGGNQIRFVTAKACAYRDAKKAVI